MVSHGRIAEILFSENGKPRKNCGNPVLFKTCNFVLNDDSKKGKKGQNMFLCFGEYFFRGVSTFYFQKNTHPHLKISQNMFLDFGEYFCIFLASAKSPKSIKNMFLGFGEYFSRKKKYSPTGTVFFHIWSTLFENGKPRKNCGNPIFRKW